MYRHLHVGTIFRIPIQQLNAPPVVANPANFPTDFRLVENRTYNLGTPQPDANPADPDFCNITAGPGAVPNRTFRWLPWVLGKVSCVPVAGDAIATGFMSGCYLTDFTMNGVRYFGHIGSSDDFVDLSEEAKNAWKAAVAQGLITINKVFQPAAAIIGSTSVIAVHSNNNHFFAIGLSNSPVVHGFHKKRVDTKIQVPGLPSIPRPF